MFVLVCLVCFTVYCFAFCVLCSALSTPSLFLCLSFGICLFSGIRLYSPGMRCRHPNCCQLLIIVDHSWSLCTSWSSTRLSAVVLSASLSAWSVLLSFSFSHFLFRLHICTRCQPYTSLHGVSVHIAPLSKAQRDHLATIAYVTLMCSSSVRPDYRTRLQRYDEQIVFCKFFASFFHIFTFSHFHASLYLQFLLIIII